VLGREYLSVDQPEDYFGHLLLGEAGVTRLLERPAIVHRDDRPRLEFLAARRFIDRRGTEGVFDSLADIRAATQGEDGTSRLLFARALAVRRGDPASLRYLDAVRRAQPHEPFWTVYTAAILLGQGDTTFADSALARVLRSGENREASLLSGLVALRRGQEARARTLLGRALATGADTAEALAGLAALDARARRWALGAAETRAALAAVRGTLRHPYPREWLSEALAQFTLNGPPATADSLLDAAVTGRSGWYKLHELRAVAALRVSRCDVAAEQFLELVDFGIELVDAPAWVERCRRGETR
jgi:predicted Zn-dependent protease